MLGKGAAKIAGGKAGDAVGKAELLHGALEGIHGLAQFGEQVGVRAQQDVVGVVGAVIGLAGVQIVAADLAEENLAFHAKTAAGGGRAAGRDQARDHLQLRAQGGGERARRPRAG